MYLVSELVVLRVTLHNMCVLSIYIRRYVLWKFLLLLTFARITVTGVNIFIRSNRIKVEN